MQKLQKNIGLINIKKVHFQIDEQGSNRKGLIL